MKLSHRERVLTALKHRQPDRVPLFYRDVPEVEQRLLKDFNMKNREELLRYLEIDFRWVQPDYIGPPLEDKNTGNRRDIWGVEYRYICFSEHAGYWEPVSRPLINCNNPAELLDYNWPKLEWFDFSVLKKQIDDYSEYAIMTAPGFCSPSILQCPIQTLIGEERSFMDLALNPDFLREMIRHALDFNIPFIEHMFEAAEGKIDFFRIGDDFGTQNGLVMSLPMFRDLIKPALKAMVDTAKKYGAYYYHHSCGAVRELIPDLIEIGVDVLDPIQVQAEGMAPAELKVEFGQQICFSGGVDEQQLLPNGSPEDIHKGVFQLLEDMARGGGFFIGPTHNFQADIPTGNILAMYEAARQWVA